MKPKKARKPRKPRSGKSIKKRARLKYLRDNPAFAYGLAWKRGVILWKLLEYQKELYDIFENSTELITVINCSRRFGKTTIAILYAIHFALKNPGSQIKIATKTQKSLQKTLRPIWNMILEDCPFDLRPKWSNTYGCYVFPNNSMIHVEGTDAGHSENLRGQNCHLAIVDEASYCSELSYIVKSILVPQTMTCGGRVFLLSTPNQRATASGEEFKEFCIKAQTDGAYYCKDIYSNKSLSPAIIERYKKEAGGEDSVNWQVEYLCKFKINLEKAIVPEWRTDKFVLPEDFDPTNNKLFRFYHKYTCMDLGVKRDFTVGLCGYYDFNEATLFILDEFNVKNTTTPNIVTMLKACEFKAFGDFPIYRRISDSDNPQLLNDFVHLHHIGISAVIKSTLEAMVNRMRIMVGLGQVKVHPRCKLLILTLENGVWGDDEQGKLHKNFGRTTALGHMDAIAALMYLIFSLNTTTNPVPTTYGINIANTLMSQVNVDSHNKDQFKKSFVTPAQKNRGR